MDSDWNFRYIFGLLITAVLLIVLIIIIISGGNGGKAKVPSTTRTLYSYAPTDATVRLTVQGPVVANQNYVESQITVGKDTTTYNQIQTYEGHVTSSQTFNNNTVGYDAFLHALDYAGFTRGNTSSKLANETGYCSLGKRYVFELMQNGKDIERFWTSSCGGTKTYLGNANLTIQLFRAQVPGYSTLSANFPV